MTNLEELRGPAFRAFVGLARAWKLTDSEQLSLLGCPSGADFSDWKEGDLATLGVDAITRISLLLGIYSALHAVFIDPDQADFWLRRTHVSGELAGSRALDLMVRNGLPGMRQLHGQLRSLVI
ncbi:hypothetical protein [Stenotrophomonas sp. S39]|uniref:hypothetical protein n=1 Tax=Stenotrophomonas sp. S39 TaxID=2767451 RepID=UPI00190CCDF4|nr:hypothetical protein [Stenotrophomonas sp. S39]MBK0052761.1 hypothetical protein [Stenotrophomonas sp. S39]